MLGFLSRYAKVIVAIFALAMFGITQTDFFRNSLQVIKAEGALIDRRYLLRGPKPPDPDIKIIGIEASSLTLDTFSPEEIDSSEALRLMRNPFPWNRKIYALLLEKLMASGAKGVVFDFFFSGPTAGDADFARALHKYHDQVTIGCMFSPVDVPEPGGDNATAQQLSYASSTLILNSTDELQGYVNCPLELDGVFRRSRCKTSKERESGKGLTWFPDDLFALSALAAQKFQKGVTFPPGDYSNFVDFRGSQGTFVSLPIENVFLEKLWLAPPFNGGATFKDKLVIVGPIADIFQDTHRTPFGAIPGPELQANRISTLLRNSFLQETSARFNFLLTLGMVVLAFGVSAFIRNVFLKGILLLIIGVGFLVMCQAVFSYQSLVVSMTPPIFGLITTGTFGVFFQYILEWLEKRQINNVLEKYVSKNVAKTILKNPKSFIDSFTGKKQKVAILFCDIRGFTTLTESVDANELVAQLNEYFSKMVHIIEEEKGGTLQKFIGDAIMAAWGDVVVRGGETDARLAIETALAMRAALIELNKTWKGKANRSDLSIGIGINYGEVVVGNIGSAKRMEFTVLGDGINLAARFESSTKQFHTDLLVGEGAEALTRNDFVFRRVGLITFKGKTKPVEVFGVISDKSTPAPSWLATYHEGVQLFRQREFISAADRFKCSEQMIGSEDFLCQMYLKACAGFLQDPPPEHWDGVFILKDK